VLFRKEVAEGAEVIFLDFNLLLHVWFLIHLRAIVRDVDMATETAEDIEAWAQAEGVPSLSDPFIQKYLSGRDALVEQEKKQRSGRSSRNRNTILR
jgi:hypothetical protein